MTTGSFGLPTKALVSLAIMQCVAQGLLIPLLTIFLSSKSSHRPWFKIYVVCVNVLTAGQTVAHVIQAFDVIELVPAPALLVAAPPILTGLIGASVQAFFIQRCWKIYHQRILPTAPLLLLWLTSLVSAIAIGGYGIELTEHGPLNAIHGLQISSKIWGFSSLILDMITTFSTIVYLHHVRKNLGGSHSVFVMVWQVMWTSATPPLILMTIGIVDGYVIEVSPGPRVVSVVSSAMTGKFLVLSLMINLVGQKYIREHFERYRSHPSPPSNIRSQTDRAHDPTVIQITVHTVEVELTSRMDPRDDNIDSQSDECLGNKPSDTTNNCSPVA
ncbi:hypothetical protein RSAG8_06154, partial [Rhizoctonia solani AG-8 WAC10335]